MCISPLFSTFTETPKKSSLVEGREGDGLFPPTVWRLQFRAGQLQSRVWWNLVTVCAELSHGKPGSREWGASSILSSKNQPSLKNRL